MISEIWVAIGVGLLVIIFWLLIRTKKGRAGTGKVLKSKPTKKVLLILVALLGFAGASLIFKSIITGALVLGGIVILYFLIFLGIKLKTTTTEKFSKDWWKEIFGAEKHKFGAVFVKIIGIIIVAAIIFILNLGIVPPNWAFGIAAVLIFILILVVFKKPEKFFIGSLIVLGLPFGFWLLAKIDAPPIASALFIIFYLILFPIAMPRTGWIFTVIGVIGLIVLIATAGKIELKGAENALTDIQAGFLDIGNWFEEQWKKIKKGGEKVLMGTLGEGYFEGEVQEAAERPLGVFIDEFKSISPTYVEDEPILLYSQLRAETLTDEPITVKIDCSLDGKEGQIIPSAKKELTVDRFALENIDCKFEGSKQKFPAGNYRAKLSAGFDFTTNAFIKAYFMDQEKLREFKAQSESKGVGERFGLVDPIAQQFGFETKPTAIYTAGPIMIGMSLGDMPLGIHEDLGDGPTLGLTIENKWNGNIKELKTMTVISPGEIQLGTIYPKGTKAKACEGCEKGSKECTCIYNLSKAYTEGQNVLTFRIHTKILDKESLLGTAPVSFKNFKVSLDYEYSLEDEIGVTIRPKEVAE